MKRRWNDFGILNDKWYNVKVAYYRDNYFQAVNLLKSKIYIKKKE